MLLPTAPFAETSGTYVNAEGSWQTMSGAVMPPGEARPAWKVLRVLGNLFELEGFDYQDSSAVLDELRERVANVAPSAPEQSSLVLDESLAEGDAYSASDRCPCIPATRWYAGRRLCSAPPTAVSAAYTSTARPGAKPRAQRRRERIGSAERHAHEFRGGGGRQGPGWLCGPGCRHCRNSRPGSQLRSHGNRKGLTGMTWTHSSLSPGFSANRCW